MKKKTPYRATLNQEIVVDNFAGGGGASTGIAMAIGRSVDLAVNHNPVAIAVHRANHPDADHYCGSVWDLKPAEVAAGNQIRSHLSDELGGFAGMLREHAQAMGENSAAQTRADILKAGQPAGESPDDDAPSGMRPR